MIKITAAFLVLGLHVAVLAGILSASTVKPEIEPADSAELRFVEIAPDPVDTAPSPTPTPQAVQPPEPEPEPVQEETPPDPVEEPPPPPEEQTPPLVEQPAEEHVEPKPEPKPKPKPKPKPVHKPRPKPRPRPVKPAPEPVAATAPSGHADEHQAPKAPAQPVDPNRPRLIGHIDYLGRRPVPVYPRLSERRGEQGRVVIRVVISPKGDVTKATVRSSSGFERLDDAALDAARSARFKPYTENGVAYAAMADIPFDFVL
jgi:protein TonB